METKYQYKLSPTTNSLCNGQNREKATSEEGFVSAFAIPKHYSSLADYTLTQRMESSIELAAVDTEHHFNQKSSKTKMISKKPKVSHWKRPADKPKRPASAYNLFFILERQRLLRGNDDTQVLYNAELVSQTAAEHRNDKPKRMHVKTHGMITFQNLSKSIATAWKSLSSTQRDIFIRQAAIEARIYGEKVALWKTAQATKKLIASVELENSTSTVNDSFHTEPISVHQTEHRMVSSPSHEFDWRSSNGKLYEDIDTLSTEPGNHHQYSSLMPIEQQVMNNNNEYFHVGYTLSENVTDTTTGASSLADVHGSYYEDEVDRNDRVLDRMVEDILRKE